MKQERKKVMGKTIEKERRITKLSDVAHTDTFHALN